MPIARFAIAASAMLFVSPAVADQSLLGIARSVTLMMGISKFCPNVISTDQNRAEQYAAVFRESGQRIAGGEVWTTTLTSEAKRRFAEVQVTGAQRWCENQRRYLREIGAKDVFR